MSAMTFIISKGLVNTINRNLKNILKFHQIIKSSCVKLVLLKFSPKSIRHCKKKINQNLILLFIHE